MDLFGTTVGAPLWSLFGWWWPGRAKTDQTDLIDKAYAARPPVALDGDYLILYIKKPTIGSVNGRMVQVGPSLNLKNTKTGEDAVILDFGARDEKGRRKLDLNPPMHAVMIPRQHLIIMHVDASSSGGGQYHEMSITSTLRVYDYAARRFLDEKEVLNNSFDGVTNPYLYELSLSSDQQTVHAMVCVINLKKQVSPTFYYNSYAIRDGKLVTLTERGAQDPRDDAASCEAQSSHCFKAANGDTLSTFVVPPGNQYGRPKRPGIYIHSEKEKREWRISSRDDGLFMQYHWIEGGRKVVLAEYLYDVSGQCRETKLLDGEILDLARIK